MMVTQGMGSQESAHRLCISAQTVKERFTTEFSWLGPTELPKPEPWRCALATLTISQIAGVLNPGLRGRREHMPDWM
jgi:hypothetical protein